MDNLLLDPKTNQLYLDVRFEKVLQGIDIRKRKGFSVSGENNKILIQGEFSYPCDNCNNYCKEKKQECQNWVSSYGVNRLGKMIIWLSTLKEGLVGLDEVNGLKHKNAYDLLQACNHEDSDWAAIAAVLLRKLQEHTEEEIKLGELEIKITYTH